MNTNQLIEYSMKRIIATLMCIALSFSLTGQVLHIYGGSNHDVYLGCMNCNKFDSNSIWNQFGTYGNKLIRSLYGTKPEHMEINSAITHPLIHTQTIHLS